MRNQLFILVFLLSQLHYPLQLQLTPFNHYSLSYILTYIDSQIDSATFYQRKVIKSGRSMIKVSSIKSKLKKIGALMLLSLQNNFGVSKKAHYASIIRHKQTTDIWNKGTGWIDSKEVGVILWNVNGFRSVLEKGQLQNLFTQYSKQADFICLNETKIDYDKYCKSQPGKKLHFEQSHNYNEYWNFCKVSSGYSGVMTYSKHLPSSIIEDMSGFGDHNKQGRILTLQFDKFYLVNLYKPNSGDQLIRLQYRMEYEDCFRNFIQKLQSSKPVIIASDMNVSHQPIDLKNPKRNQGRACYTPEERSKFTQLLTECNMVDSFRHLNPTTSKYSYFSYRGNARLNNVGWRLDYVLVDKRLQVHYADILTDVFGSDHCPVLAKIKLK